MWRSERLSLFDALATVSSGSRTASQHDKRSRTGPAPEIRPRPGARERLFGSGKRVGTGEAAGEGRDDLAALQALRADPDRVDLALHENADLAQVRERVPDRHPLGMADHVALHRPLVADLAVLALALGLDL